MRRQCPPLLLDFILALSQSVTALGPHLFLWKKEYKPPWCPVFEQHSYAHKSQILGISERKDYSLNYQTFWHLPGANDV